MGRPENQPWPFWPMRLRTSSSHKEGADRCFSISTKSFVGDTQGNLKKLITVEVEWVTGPENRPVLRELEGTEKEWNCDLVLLALGFTGSEPNLASALGVEMDSKTNIEASAQGLQDQYSRGFCGRRPKKGAIPYRLGHF